jgi:hypothetical protein
VPRLSLPHLGASLVGGVVATSGAAITVNRIAVAVTEVPSSLTITAKILVVPVAMAVTSPSTTVATLGFVEVHPMGAVAVVGVTVAVSVNSSPTSNDHVAQSESILISVAFTGSFSHSSHPKSHTQLSEPQCGKSHSCGNSHSLLQEEKTAAITKQAAVRKNKCFFMIFVFFVFFCLYFFDG